MGSLNISFSALGWTSFGFGSSHSFHFHNVCRCRNILAKRPCKTKVSIGRTLGTLTADITAYTNGSTKPGHNTISIQSRSQMPPAISSLVSFLCSIVDSKTLHIMPLFAIYYHPEKVVGRIPGAIPDLCATMCKPSGQTLWWYGQREDVILGAASLFAFCLHQCC